jgi:hypothetical protein
MLRFNEGKACEAIMRHLEERERMTRTDVQRPETVNHPDPVEVTWQLGNRLFALEHTGIEPFEGYMLLNAEAKRHFDPISEALKGELPDGVFELHLPVGAMCGLKKAEVLRAQQGISDWVRQTAPTLKPRSYADYTGNVSWSEVLDVPFKVKLYHFARKAQQEGRLQFRNLIVSDIEQQRRDRIARACEKKFPKLAHTVLVLEENDVQLTNYAIVAETYLSLAQPRVDRPDETYLLSSSGDPWYIWPILIDDKTLHDLAVDDYVKYWIVDPETLTSATTR